MSDKITLNGALAEELRAEAQAQNSTVEELLGYLLQLARSEGRRREALTQIEQISEQIAREFMPEKIILFGSYAYGIPRQGSDIDLLVIMPFEGRHREQAVKIHTALGTLLPLDLMVRRPEEIAERIKIGDSFIREIVERGKVLYEAKHNGVDRIQLLDDSIKERPDDFTGSHETVGGARHGAEPQDLRAARRERKHVRRQLRRPLQVPETDQG
jgi:predicted nucleotidyltransferase